jgi:hypothetical protein
LSHANFPANNLNFHWRWWDWIQPIFLNNFYFKFELKSNYWGKLTILDQCGLGRLSLLVYERKYMARELLWLLFMVSLWFLCCISHISNFFMKHTSWESISTNHLERKRSTVPGRE